MSSIDEDYQSVKSYEYFKSKLSIFIGILVLAGTIFIGYKLFNTKNKHTEEINADVTKVSVCNQRIVYNQGYSTSYFDCIVDIQYIVDGKKYQQLNYGVPNNTFPLQQGSKVKIAYDPNNPTDISNTSAGDDKTAGIMFFIFGLVYLGIVVYHYYINVWYPGVAAVRGVKDS